MAQELRRKLEIGVLCVIAVIFLVVAGNYYADPARKTGAVVTQTAQNVQERVQRDERTAALAAPHAMRTTPVQEIDAALRYSPEESTWILNDAPEYVVTADTESLTISKKDDTAQRFTVTLTNFGDIYGSTSGKVALPIPTDAHRKDFVVSEQEDFLPILGYHDIVPDDADIPDDKKTFAMRVSDFEAQIAYMTNVAGCQWYTFGHLMENYVLQEKKLPRNACAINFDDGRISGFELAFPILQKYDAVATFYMIIDLVGREGYISWEQLDEMYRAGNEIGSHTISGGSMTNKEFFEKKFGTSLDRKELERQIGKSKKILTNRGYNVTTFAYPRGEWNDDVVDVVKESGYHAARDTSRDYLALDRRTPTASATDDYLWHMHYHKPELQTPEELATSLAYTGWWQFEEGFHIGNDPDRNIRALVSKKLDDRSFQIITLPDPGDRIENKFIVGNAGNYTIEVFVQTGDSFGARYKTMQKTKVLINGEPIATSVPQNPKCVVYSGKHYCPLTVTTNLTAGIHILGVENTTSGFQRVDRFRVFKNMSAQESFDITIAEFASASETLTKKEEKRVLVEDFENPRTIVESGFAGSGVDKNWQLTSGGVFTVKNGVGKTLQSNRADASLWRLAYLKHNAADTNDGFRPQNIFRLLTNSQWESSSQEVYFSLSHYDLSSSNNRDGDNGVLLFSRYQDQDNLYYVGVRVDGQAVIKKKVRGTYETLAVTKVFEGNYDRKNNPNLLPLHAWIGVKSVVQNSESGTTITLFVDKENDGSWQEVLNVEDSNPFPSGHVGIRTDFMDVSFDNYHVEELMP